VVVGDRLTQLRKPAAIRVVGLAGFDGADAGLRGCGMRGEIRLADLEVDHVFAGTLHLEGALHHLHREEGAHLGGSTREVRRHAVRLARWLAPCQASSPR